MGTLKKGAQEIRAFISHLKGIRLFLALNTYKLSVCKLIEYTYLTFVLAIL
jgi:hypothetical protein